MLCFIAENFALANDYQLTQPPKCPKRVTLKEGIVIDAPDWSYSIPNHFIEKKTGKITIEDGILVSDFPLPQVSHHKKHTNSVTGGLSADSEEITENSERYTWDIEKINSYSTAVFFCNLHGDENKTPVPYVLLYQIVPAEIKSCTITYRSKNNNRIPESQTLECR